MNGIESEFDQRVQTGARRGIKPRMTRAAAISGLLDRSFDFVYIAALHPSEGAKIDLNRWRYKIRLGGILGGHDYESMFPGVTQAVAETFGKPDQTGRGHSRMKRIN